MAHSANTIRLPPITKANKRKSATHLEAGTSTSKREKVFLTPNRFEPLSGLVQDVPCTDEKDNNDVEMNTQNESRSGDIKKSAKPPPIILHGKPSLHKQFVSFVQTHTTKQFNLKYSNDTTSIYLTDIDDWKKLKQSLKDEDAEYHSFTTKEEKTHAFVLKGLDDSAEIEEIESGLKEANLDIIKVYRMKSRNPLFLVITKNDVRLKHLQEKIKCVNYTRITWERYFNKKIITQCHRCQMWNHATSNCNAKPACLKCAEDHWTADCGKPKESPAKCVNCKGDHPANSTSCPTYTAKLEKITQQRSKKPEGHRFNLNSKEFPVLRQKFIPAPPPTTNIWKQSVNARGPTPITASQEIPAANADPAPKSSGSGQQVKTNNDSNKLNELFSEFKKLNSMINIDNMLKAVRDLNGILENCQSTMDKFQAFSQFALRIDSYGI